MKTCLDLLRRFALTTLLTIGLPPVALALDASWSGFATLAYSQSDQSVAYEENVDDQGTFNRDSIVGAQLDIRFSPRWWTTFQLTIGPAVEDSDAWEPTLTWALLSWQMKNDLLLRVGKLRMPMYLYSEALDVGVSYDLLHLPTEVYSTAPADDFIGGAITKTWELTIGDLTLDAYCGETTRASSVHTRSSGIVVSVRRNDNLYRLGVQQAYIDFSSRNDLSQGERPPIPTPVATFGTPQAIPATQENDEDIDTQVLILGLDQSLGHDVRLIGEYARRYAKNMDIGKNTNGGYLSLQKKSGRWTPYLTYGRLVTDKAARRAATHFADQPSDFSNAYDDQVSWALGASYAASMTSKLKAEWMQIHLGDSSTLVASPSGMDLRGETINVLSLAYSLAF